MLRATVRLNARPMATAVVVMNVITGTSGVYPDVELTNSKH